MNSAINPNYVNLMFSPHKAFRMVCWIYEYECMNFYEPCMRERVRTCFVEHHILSYKTSRHNSIIRNMQHGNNIYSMPNGFMLSIGKENIYDIPWRWFFPFLVWFAYNFNYNSRWEFNNTNYIVHLFFLHHQNYSLISSVT